MTATLGPLKSLRTISDLLHDLGDVPSERVLLHPAPGTATPRNVIELRNRDRRLYELVDGTLVEKGMGYRESLLAIAIAAALRAFVNPRQLGLVSGESGMVQLFADLVRIPDVAFVSWKRIPGGRVPTEPAPSLAPELAVEVLSKSNTPAEMARKRREYFQAGVLLVWEVDPDARTVAVYAAPDTFKTLSSNDSLDGGEVLPGLLIPLGPLFGELDLQPPENRQP